MWGKNSNETKKNTERRTKNVKTKGKEKRKMEGGAKRGSQRKSSPAHDNELSENKKT